MGRVEFQGLCRVKYRFFLAILRLFPMEIPPEPRVVYVERLGGGVVIGFEDGRTALYSAAFLHSVFEGAQELSEPEEAD
jgi:hypothetical protein